MLPKVILHNSISLDGKVEGFEPDIGLHYELASKFDFDVHLVGSETILKQEDELQEDTENDFEPFEEDPNDKRALLVIPDSRGRIKRWCGLRKSGFWRNCIALVSESSPKRYLNYLEKRHIEYIITGLKKVDYNKALEELNKKYKTSSIMLDSGGILNSIFFREKLVNEISLLVHPVLVGDSTKVSFFTKLKDLSYDGIIKLKLKSIEKKKGSYIWLRYTVLK